MFGVGDAMNCGEVKQKYKDSDCCGQPMKVASTLQCTTREAELASMAPSAIFDPPSGDEMNKIKEVMMAYDFSAEGAEITLTAQPLAGPDSSAILELFGGAPIATTQLSSPATGYPIWGGIMTNYISRIDTLPPGKNAAVAFLAGDGSPPPRYAKVNVAFGGLDAPKFTEYKVGPLDAAVGDVTVTKLADQLWGSRPREGNEMRALKTMVDLILNEDGMKTICSESFGGATHGAGLNNHEPAPPGLVGNQRKTQILINFKIDGTWRGKDLHLVPLSFTIDNTDRDPSMWVATDFYYNAQGPYDYQELIDKYQQNALVKVTVPEEHRALIQKSAFPQRRPELGTREFADMPGPSSYMPMGPRYNVQGRTITWMGWSFHAGYTFRAGPDFHSISFKGESIAYQVALNEVGLIYSADDPVAGNVFFLDSTFGNGEYRELIRGIDCPEYATYLTNFWWAAPGGTQTALRSTCVFEMVESGGPLWRRGGSFVSGLRDEVLKVRFAMPNGNYDYIVTYTFSLDGKMRVDVGSTGYMQTHFWSTARGPHDSMAYKVHTYSGGSLHDHTYGFKVDLDIKTQTNSFEVLEYKMSDTLTALNSGRAEGYSSVPPYMLYPKMRYVTYTTIENENDARLSINPATPKAWLFGDKTQTNKWGNMRAYKLKLDANPSSVVDADHHTMPAFSYAKQMLSVTKYKEDEQTLSGPYDLNRLDDPQGAFDDMVDGDNIEQEDIVAWVTMTALHLPAAEDYPMTNQINHGFTLLPNNFFDENAAMDMPHYLRMMDSSDTRTENPPAVPECVPPTFDMEHTFAGA